MYRKPLPAGRHSDPYKSINSSGMGPLVNDEDQKEFFSFDQWTFCRHQDYARLSFNCLDEVPPTERPTEVPTLSPVPAMAKLL